MRASDLMTNDVVHVDADCTIKDAADLMLQHRVSALPVLNRAKRLVGIVSEGDLIRRVELGTERKRGRLSRFFTDTSVLAEEFIRSHTRQVADVMTMAVVTAAPDAKLADIADLMEQHKIRRIPIVERDRLVGIISRPDLMRALSEAAPSLVAATMVDRMIHDAITGEFDRQSWARESDFEVAVSRGKVRLTGMVASDAQRHAALVLARGVPGVEDVEDRIGVVPYQIGLPA